MTSRIWLIVLVFLIASTSASLVAPIETRFISSLLHDRNLGLIGVPFAIGMIFYPVFSMILCCYLNIAQKIIGWACLACAAAVVLSIFSADIYMYSLAKIPWALAAVLCGPVLLVHLQHYFHGAQNKEHFFGYLNAAQALLGSAFAYVGGALGERSLRVPFFVLAAVFVVTGIVVFLFRDKKFFCETANTLQPNIAFAVLGRNVPAGFMLFYITGFSLVFVNLALRPLIWPQLFQSLPKSNLLVGSIFSVMGIVAFISSFGFGRIAGYFGLKPVILGSMSLILVCNIGILRFAQIPALLYVFAVGIAACEAMLMPARISIISMHIPKKLLGAFGGLDTLLTSVFSVSSVLIFGQLQARTGVGQAYGFFIGLSCLALITTCWMGYSRIRFTAKKSLPAAESEPA